MVKMKVLKIKLAFLVLMMATVLNTESRQPVLHRVGGGRLTWKTHVNFTDWATHEKFYVGDWLFFGFNKKLYTVLQVNKTSYDKCIDKNFIKNITRGGRDVFNLTEAKPYYFVSGRGFCFKGLKVAIIVQNYPAFKPRNGSIKHASNYFGKLILLVMVAYTVTSILL